MRKRLLAVFSLVLVGASCAPAAESPSSPGGGNQPPGTGGASAGGRGGNVSATGGSGGSSGGATGGSGSGATGGSGGSGTGGSGGSGGSVATGGSGGSGSGGSSGATGGSSAAGGSGGSAAGDAAATETPATTGGTCQGAKKCFDFEDQMAGMAPKGADFTVQTAGGVTADASKAFSGTKSILIKTNRGTNFPGNNLIFNGIAQLLPENDLHGRVMVWMSTTPGAAHWDSIIGSAAGGANPTYILGGMYKNFMSVYHPGDASVDSATPFPTGTWACVQWQFKGAKDGTHLHKMMLNGQVVDKGIQDKDQGTPRRDWKAPTFGQLKVGYRHFGSSVAVDMWIDDLAFGDQPIACPPMK